MKFILSKISWLFLNPANIWFLFLSLGIVLCWTKKWKLGRLIISLALFFAGFIWLSPFSKWVNVSLENRFAIPLELPDKVEGIIVLGGFANPVLSVERKARIMGGPAERLTEFLILSKRYPEAKLVFTGGSGSLTNQELKEAHLVKEIIADLGFDTSRMLFEEHSRNTYENALFTKPLVNPEGKWILITSAFHMPRAMGCFRQTGWDVIAYPAGFMTNGNYDWELNPDFTRGISALSAGAREWLGLLAYYVMGRTNALFPQ